MNAYFRFQAYEIIKVKNTMPCEILTKIPLQKDSQYSLRNSATLQGGSFKNVIYGSENMSCLGPKIGTFYQQN